MKNEKKEKREETSEDKSQVKNVCFALIVQ